LVRGDVEIRLPDARPRGECVVVAGAAEHVDVPGADAIAVGLAGATNCEVVATIAVEVADRQCLTEAIATLDARADVLLRVRGRYRHSVQWALCMIAAWGRQSSTVYVRSWRQVRIWCSPRIPTMR
jgi:hypothetical protein